MKDISRYFDIIDSLIRHSGVIVDDDVWYEIYDPLSGFIEGILYFYDNSRLEFAEAIYIVNQKAVKTRYRYQ